MSFFASGTGQARERIDVERWERRALLELFQTFDEPYHGVCVRVDCSATFRLAKADKLSVFLSLVHRSLVAANQVGNFRIRAEGDGVWRYGHVNAGSAVGRDNGTIGFGHYPFAADLRAFVAAGTAEIARVKARTDLERAPGMDLIRYSVLPWLDFTSISHARQFARKDTAPHITFGKITETGGRHTLPVSIHVHHGLVDGAHVAAFVQAFEAALAEPEGR